MKNITLIVGLPASGKTTYALTNYPSSLLIDDPMDLIADVLDKIKESPKTFVTIIDPHFCYKKTLDTAYTILSNLSYTIDIVYFENNPGQCILNSRVRNSFAEKKIVENFIIEASKEYVIPENDVIIPVWK